MNNLKKAAVLFGQFFQFGCFTFGGGWSIVAQMQKLYVEKEKTITSQELLDITSVGRSLPGTMIGNVAMLYGYRAAGIPVSYTHLDVYKRQVFFRGNVGFLLWNGNPILLNGACGNPHRRHIILQRL